MKRAQQCPKCQGKVLWVVERYRIPGEYAGGVELPVVAHQQEVGGGFLSMGRTTAQGHFDLWVCEGCGYTELWARDLRNLRDAPEHGVRRIDNSTEGGGPFR